LGRWPVASGRARAVVTMARTKKRWFQRLVRAMRTGLSFDDISSCSKPRRPRRGWPGRPYEFRSVYDGILSEKSAFLHEDYWEKRWLREGLVFVLWQR